MATIDFASVDAYIAAQSPSARPMLEEVRRAIRAALPHADEEISYKMPTYKVAGKPVIYFASWKEHYSVYPATDRVVTPLVDALAPYTVNRGTIRFPLAAPVPAQLITQIAALRAEEVAEIEKARSTPRIRR
jgi:uncharacterized protein YdhG (YjbR/CyaY superfamily)